MCTECKFDMHISGLPATFAKCAHCTENNISKNALHSTQPSIYSPNRVYYPILYGILTKYSLCNDFKLYVPHFCHMISIHGIFKLVGDVQLFHIKVVYIYIYIYQAMRYAYQNVQPMQYVACYRSNMNSMPVCYSKHSLSVCVCAIGNPSHSALVSQMQLIKYSLTHTFKIQKCSV